MVSNSLTILGLASKLIQTEAEAKVAVRCPDCAAPAAFSAEALDSGGRMARCGRCGTAWLARLHSNDQYGTASGESAALPAIRRSGRPRFEQVVEHVGASFAPKTPSAKPRKPARPAQPAKPPKFAKTPRPKFDWLRLLAARRAVQMWSASAAALVLVVLVTLLTVNSSLFGGSAHGEMKQFAGLEIRLVRGALEPMRNGHMLAVEGAITNRTNGEIDVPAVRVSLRSGGSERYSWLVEPSTTRLDAGGTVVFRSVLAAPPAGVDEVAFRLTERRNTIVGMR
jgi:predicted Zn finger-like uncharacterized protein